MRVSQASLTGAPFGGFGQSGLGRELGAADIDTFAPGHVEKYSESVEIIRGFARKCVLWAIMITTTRMLGDGGAILLAAGGWAYFARVYAQ